jgi:ABC-type antimicrobial peptide transport system permease subunit
MTPHNLLFPIRQLTKRPGIAVAIVLVMAAGIGVNAAVFSVVYAVLLKPLPYPDPQQLVFISGTSGTGERIPTPTDLTTLLLTAAVLSAVAFLACLAPALRAANLDPIEAIRER